MRSNNRYFAPMYRYFNKCLMSIRCNYHSCRSCSNFPTQRKYIVFCTCYTIPILFCARIIEKLFGQYSKLQRTFAYIGYNPKHFRGRRTGVYVGVWRSDATESWIYEKNASEGTGFHGNARFMLATRISFALGLNGKYICKDMYHSFKPIVWLYLALTDNVSSWCKYR